MYTLYGDKMTEWKNGEIKGKWVEMIGTAFFTERKDRQTGKWIQTGRPYTKEEAEEVLAWLKTNYASYLYSDFRIIQRSWTVQELIKGEN